MSPTARRAAAALLCAVVLGALGLATISLPSTDEPPEPWDVTLDFDPFVPGHTQIRSSTVNVPVSSLVASAGVVSSSSPAHEIDVDFTLCNRSTCLPFHEGVEVEPGTYTLNISATLVPGPDGGLGTVSDTRLTGGLSGQILLVENSASTMTDPTVLVGLAAIGVAVVAVAAALQQRREIIA